MASYLVRCVAMMHMPKTASRNAIYQSEFLTARYADYRMLGLSVFWCFRMFEIADKGHK